MNKEEGTLSQDIDFYPVKDGKINVGSSQMARVQQMRDESVLHYRKTGDKSLMIKVGLFSANRN